MKHAQIHGLHLIKALITIINKDLYALYDCLYQKMISPMIDGLTGPATRGEKPTHLDHSNFLITYTPGPTMW